MQASSRRGPRGHSSLSFLVSLAALGAGVLQGACTLEENGASGGAPAGSSSEAAASGGPGTGGGTGGVGGVGGGTGGVGGVGGMGGAGGTGGSGPVAIREWDATKAPKTGQPPVYDLGGWLSITCDTDKRTSQSSASTIVTDYGPNAARPRNVGAGWGLSVESLRTNKLLNSDSWSGSTWAKNGMYGMAESGSLASPAGSMVATLFGSMGNQQSSYASGLPLGFASSWVKGSNGAAPYAHIVVDKDADTKWETFVPVDTNTWKRYGVAGGEGYLRLETRGDPNDGNPAAIATSSDIAVYGAQLEPGVDYASSYIPTLNAERTRNADKLYVNAPAAVAPLGFFHVKLTFAPVYALGETAANEHDLFYIDSSNRLYLRLSDGKIALRVDGTEIQSLPINWQPEQAITVEAIHSPTERRLIVSGPTPSDFSDTPFPLKPVSLLAPFHVLGNSNGAQECADLRYLGFFPPN